MTFPQIEITALVALALLGLLPGTRFAELRKVIPGLFTPLLALYLVRDKGPFEEVPALIFAVLILAFYAPGFRRVFLQAQRGFFR